MNTACIYFINIIKNDCFSEPARMQINAEPARIQNGVDQRY